MSFDYLTGDDLAELTMLILGRDQMKDEQLGYARTFVKQVADCLGLAQERGVKIVANAGGLNPAALAVKLREVAASQGLDVAIAHVEGDDLRDRSAELGFGEVLTANAYLGAFGIASALLGGADVVVTGRVTDASVVVGPAIAHFGWGRDDLDELAGAVVAGHVIECGTQATGGNFAGFGDIDMSTSLGFPIAEIAADGSCIITKHDGTGGAVTVDTVTAQLVYEVGSPIYLGPDVSTRLDTMSLAQIAPDRVAITGVVGEPPPPTVKVCLNELGGFRNSVEFLLTGLDIPAKAESSSSRWSRPSSAMIGPMRSSGTWIAPT
ncbi:acyclic terpene utilization AtuA family protein [Aeromicrobium sp. UC242_57]|uniref:acyclic terpene utilization AtuA family protein n=1 Tax=Aeromicrobium sp. UC242_57 TaxID=3374624 RepID=UPI00378CFEAC